MKAFLLAALAAASAHAAVPELYVRGGFNGWGIDNPLVARGPNVYEAVIELPPGYHGFKLGARDWSAEWVLDSTASVSVKTGQSYRLDAHAGPEDFLFVRTMARYRFVLDASAAPTLRIEELPTPAAKAGDPHPLGTRLEVWRFPTWDGKTEQARFSTTPVVPAQAGTPGKTQSTAASAHGLRNYVQSTTQALRDPVPSFVSYTEQPDLPRVRSGSVAFDALFALALTEFKQDSVARIADGNYNGGAAISCDCFETGERWHYVWTRDLSYAASLGLALLDPARVRNSLEFKLSGYRPGLAKAAPVAGSADGLQIIQDTGSGGSWPVSTDRVSWAFGAEATLANLPPAQRAAFAPTALKALANTIENDRIAAWDARTGLYTGEQSFLDWREQTYASWIVDDIASMASSKALSTNVAHYKALMLAAQLAHELHDAALAARYRAWAAALKDAINRKLWLPDAGLYSSLTAAHFDGAPLRKFDWLGQALAIVTGVADARQTARILASYPHGPMGAPVIYPQQPGRPVYHNRAIWPFVTAYGLRAAAIGKNVAVADAAYATLLRGAALNLSNMENLEWLSGQPLLLDEAHPELIGPVINSRRQLWSVGAYLGMVIEDVFGVHATADGIELAPFVTARLRRERFGATRSVELDNLRLHGKTIRVTLVLPPADSGEGYYRVEAVRVNGRKAASKLTWSELGADNRIEIRLGALEAGDQRLTRVNAHPYEEAPAVFAPREPSVAGSLSGVPACAGMTARSCAAQLVMSGDAGARFNIYRDGQLAAAGLPAGAWTDNAPRPRACYSVEAVFPSSGNRSHRSEPWCVDGGLLVPVTDPRIDSSIAPSGPDARFDLPRIVGWGKPTDRFVLRNLRVASDGTYAVQIQYHNAANQINLGISGGVKWLTVRDASGAAVAQGVVQLPHARLAKAHTPLVFSTPLAAALRADTPYRLELHDFYNMSYLQANSTFSAAGGTAGPSNQFDIAGVRVRAVERP